MGRGNGMPGTGAHRHDRDCASLSTGAALACVYPEIDVEKANCSEKTSTGLYRTPIVLYQSSLTSLRLPQPPSPPPLSQSLALPPSPLVRGWRPSPQPQWLGCHAHTAPVRLRHRPPPPAQRQRPRMAAEWCDWGLRQQRQRRPRRQRHLRGAAGRPGHPPPWARRLWGTSRRAAHGRSVTLAVRVQHKVPAGGGGRPVRGPRGPRVAAAVGGARCRSGDGAGGGVWRATLCGRLV